jgi:hypothetical protein
MIVVLLLYERTAWKDNKSWKATTKSEPALNLMMSLN